MCTDDVFVEARLERRGTPCTPAKRLCGAGTILRTSPLGPLVTRDARPGHRMCRLALHNNNAVGPSETTSSDVTTLTLLYNSKTILMNEIQELHIVVSRMGFNRIFAKIPFVVSARTTQIYVLVHGSWRHPPSRPAGLACLPACLQARQRATGEWPLLWLLRLS